MNRMLRAAALMALLALAAAANAQASAAPLKLRSPNGRVEISFQLSAAGAPTYAVSYDQQPVINTSALGLLLKQGEPLTRNLTLVSATRRAHDEVYELVVGKTCRARDHYRELTVALAERGAPGRRLQLIFRAYDDGAAFRYVLPAQAALRELELTDEQSEFRFPTDLACWALRLRTFHSNYEKEFDRVSLDQIKPGAITGLPLVIQATHGPTIAIAEADLQDYAGMYLQAIAGAQHALVSRLSPPREGSDARATVRVALPHASPWRVVMISDAPGRLIESTLILNLNKPCALRDSSWIKPGKAAWAWWSGHLTDGGTVQPGMNDATMKHYIDFAAEFKLEYMILDAGWYTPRAYGDDADTKADITKSVPEIDLPGLVNYGRARGVGIIVWLHWLAARDQMERAFPYYERIGVKGVKVDFMDHDDQAMVAFYHRIVKTAAAHHLLVDLHGAYKPTGLARTYPNYITEEGVLGAEYNKWTARVTPTHNLTLPFTRMLTGPMDYTPGGFRNVTAAAFKPQETGPMVQTTRTQQLAMYVVYDSPLQMVADNPGAYRGQAGADFLRVVPASWDETRVLAGAIGESIIVARRSGARWFVGAMTNESARTLQLPLNFLARGAYRLTAYADGADAATEPKQVATSTQQVRASESLTLKLAPGGGYAAWLEPVR